MKDLLLEVLAGELTAPAPRRLGRLTRLPDRLLTLHADERGMLSLVSMVTMLFFLILVATVTNIGRTINLKIDAQNTADAAAYSASVEMARGMNAVTATNHLMGELLSFVVVHRAIGGPELEKGTDVADQEPFELKMIALEYKIGLPVAYNAAKYAMQIAGGPYAPFAYDDGPVKDDIKTGATTRDGKIRLKLALQADYWIKVAAAALILCKPIPIVGPILYAAGMALGAVAEVMEALILAEWKVLSLMEKVASNKALLKFRDIMYTWMLPNAYSYMKFVEATSGTQASRAAMSIAEANGFRCCTLGVPMLLGIPVKPENYPGSADEKKEAFGMGNASLFEGTIPLAGKLTTSAKAKEDKTNTVAADAKNDGATQEEADDGEGEFKVPSCFQLSKFYIPTPLQFEQEHGVFSGGKPPYVPQPVVENVSKWEYGEDGLRMYQNCMATFPWVCYDRKPIMIFASWMVVSNTTGLFRYYSNGYTIERGQYLSTRKKKPALFFILKGSNSGFKGVEIFTGWPTLSLAAKQAKSFFTVRAIVQRPPENPFSKSFFFMQSPEVGELAYARAMFYNAGEYPDPESESIFGKFFGSFLTTYTDEFSPPHQGGVPYDTLNWEDPSDSNNARRWSGLCKYGAILWPLGLTDATLLDGCPKIKLMWEAKLTPVEMSLTDVAMARVMFPPQLTKPMARAFPFPNGFKFDPDNITAVMDQLKSVKDILENH